MTDYTPAAIRHLDAALQRHRVQDCRVCVGLSGGRDSVALLAALTERAGARRLEVGAVHVNHGLSAHADDWSGFCASLCARLGVPLAVERVEVRADSGLGLEATARQARYRVLSRQNADFIVLAHHLDDQIETFFLQLLRGAGARGLAAMPELRRPWEQGPRLLRPWLQLPRAEIERYAHVRGLAWIDDESNADTALDRNFLRDRVLPLIAQRFPGYRGTIARSARNLAEAAQLGEQLAEQDRQAAACGDGVRVSALAALALPRALNLLRHLFVRAGAELPRRAALEEALRQCLSARCDAQVRVDAGGVSVRRYRDGVFVTRSIDAPRDWEARWAGDAALVLPAGLGELQLCPAGTTGIAADKLYSGPVTVRFRQGGERMALSATRPHRELSHLFQDAGVPPWVRDCTPLLFCAQRLVCVPGVGVAAEFQAPPNAPSLRLEWRRGRGDGQSTC